VLILIALPFVGPHVASARVLPVGARQAALVDLQQSALTIGAAGRVARINRPGGVRLGCRVLMNPRSPDCQTARVVASHNRFRNPVPPRSGCAPYPAM